MPAVVTGDPLGLACVFSGGVTAMVPYRGRVGLGLAGELLAGLAGLLHPHGNVDARVTVVGYMRALRRMVDALTEDGFRGQTADLTRARLAEYWLGASTQDEWITRRVVSRLDDLTPVLRPEVRALVDGRCFNQPPRFKALAPYSDTEWDRLISTCRQLIASSYTAHKKAREEAAWGADPRVSGWTPRNLRWWVTRHGPMNVATLAGYQGVNRWSLRLGADGVRDVYAELFPPTDVVIAYRLLLGAYTGIVPDGIADLGLDDIDWAGDATILLDYVKGRTAKESLTLSPRAVRLLEQWLDHSALARSLAPPPLRGCLWLRYWSARGGPWLALPPTQVSVARWVSRHRLLGEDGRPLSVHLHRIRTTFQSLRERRAWHGSARASIDPNHSARVEGDNYLSVATPAQQHAVEQIVEDAQHDMLRRARPPTVLDEAHTAALARDYPRLVGGLRLDDAAMAELVGGQRDVFVAACADQLAGLHGPVGKPCPARPWVCLLCPLAVFAPRHAGNLLRLKAFFARQWRVMPAPQFMAVFGPYASRIDEILTRYDPSALARMAAQVADRDDELPLRPEEHTA